MREPADIRLTAFIALSVVVHAVVLLGLVASTRLPSTPATLTLAGVVSVEIAANENRPGEEIQNDIASDKRQAGNTVAANNGAPEIPPPDPARNRQAVPSRQSVSGKNNTVMSELQRLLLTEINRHKHYPFSALRMKQQGTARVGFRLRKNGHIDTLAVLRSSGHQSLDRAALSAIDDIQPFAPADRLLDKPTHLQIDIVFQL